MNKTKIHKFREEWKKLKGERDDLNYRMAHWASNLRAEYPDGDVGDKGFHDWLIAEFGVPAKEREALLDMVRAIGIVPDQPTWNALGGSDKIRPIVRMPRKEQVAILSAAKVEGKKVRDVIIARDRAQAARSIAPMRGADTGRADASTIKRWACQLSADTLADALAEQIADGILVAPLHVVAAAKRRAAVLRRVNAKKAA